MATKAKQWAVLFVFFLASCATASETSQSKLNAALLDAAYRGDQTEVAQLIEEGANVNSKTEGGLSPLYLASTYEVSKYLVEHGAQYLEPIDPSAPSFVNNLLTKNFDDADIVNLLLWLRGQGLNFERKNERPSALRLALSLDKKMVATWLACAGAKLDSTSPYEVSRGSDGSIKVYFLGERRYQLIESDCKDVTT